MLCVGVCIVLCVVYCVFCSVGLLRCDVSKRVSLYSAIVIDYPSMVMLPNYQHFQFNCASRIGNTILAGVGSCIDEKGV